MTSIGKKFMEQTKYQYLKKSHEELGKTQPSLQICPRDSTKLIDLPDIKNIGIPKLDLTEAIKNRESIRDYGKSPLNLEELAYLLWCTQGVKAVTSRPATLRTVPSAGARHAFEVYLLVNNVKGIMPGIYRYLALEHKLLPVNLTPGLAEKVSGAALKQDFIKESAVTFIWTAVAYRMTWRYGERGYRYLHLDAGHAAQNLYLGAQAMDSGVCVLGAFNDDQLNKLLELDGEEQFALYLATVGKLDK